MPSTTSGTGHDPHSAGLLTYARAPTRSGIDAGLTTMETSPRNQAALLTPRGAAALAVIRIAGPAVAAWLQKRFTPPAKPLRPTHGELHDDAEAVLDDPVVIVSESGDWADLCLHGGLWVVESALQLLQRDGFEMVASSDLIREAADDVEEAVLAALPRATTELALGCLLAQPPAWRALLGKFGVHWSQVFNATPGTVLPADLIDRLRAMADDAALHWLLHRPTVAIAGAANAGKSTLANRLLSRERSIVADLPGTTRDWVGEEADLEGLPVLLADTPGIRLTDDPIEAAAITQSLTVITSADLVIAVLDATRPPAEQRSAVDPFPHAIRVVNKCDVAPPPQLQGDWLPISARTGQGMDQLIERIHRRFGVWRLNPELPRWWMPAQRDRLRELR